MSMVAVTRDLPRSRDGLPMDRVEAPFGPLFSGLPGGLALTFTLDGDGVAAATTDWGRTWRGLEAAWPGPAATFSKRLADLDPFSPVAYAILGRRAVEAAAGVVAPGPVNLARIREAEWERVRSHLGWLAEFAALMGDRALAQRAAVLHLAFARVDDVGAMAPSSRGARALAASVRDDRAIRARLNGVGNLGGAELARCGPVARAAGIREDARLRDPAYEGLPFTAPSAEGDDALARLQVRMAEIRESLDLLASLPSAVDVEADDQALPPNASGTGISEVETPRGAARLDLVLERGEVVAARLETPTDLHATLVSPVTAEAEVADALIAVASLDLSPWEHDR